MLKKISILLFVLLIVQMVIYARLYANDLVQQAESISANLKGNAIEEGQDYDVDDYLRSAGIQTSVNETQLEEKYPSTNLVTDPSDGNTIIRFYNPQSNNYRLDIYDVSKGLVASFVNLNSENVVINKKLFDTGSYIYKLSGESNIYCGTFILR